MKKTAQKTLKFTVLILALSLAISQTVTYAITPVYNETLKIQDLKVTNPAFDPSDNQEVKLTFLINKTADVTFKIYDSKDKEIVVLAKNKSFDKGEVNFTWNGQNDFKEIQPQGDYSYVITAETSAEKAEEKGTIKIKKGAVEENQTTDPRLKDVYVTKDSFDPGLKEVSYIVYTLTSTADVTVIIYDSSGNKIEKLLDENGQSAGIYSIMWDGQSAGYKEGSYSYRITAKNSVGEVKSEGSIFIEKDDKATGKPNIYKDGVDKIPYEPKNENLYVSFKLDKDADVTIEIKSGSSVVETVVENMEMPEGPQKIGWDGRDKYGQYVEDGIYQYKITADNLKGKDFEVGTFSVKDVTQAKNQFDKCGTFNDVSKNYKYCEAITWAQGEGIFQGYNDGNFRPDKYINRVEALKVILTALHVQIQASDEKNHGFGDIDRFAWYMSYFKTALSLGIVNGYPDSTFRPDRAVLRIEALVMLLNTGKAKNNITIPTSIYGQPYYDTPNTSDSKWYLSYAWFAKSNSLNENENYFYPDLAMSRGEMADMLYRYHKAGL